MSKRTENALLARGFDSHLASRLANSGVTLANLKSMQRNQLLNLGLNEHYISIVYSEPRPPIPEKTLLSVLYKNRRTCCVCRITQKPIILHHINEWSISRDHSEQNLATLCLDCHDLAHSKKQLSQNLIPSEILNCKLKWEYDVSTLDTQTILRLKQERDVARWDWINLQRVFELLNNLEFSIEDSPFITQLKSNNIIDSRGFIKDEQFWNLGKSTQHYFIDFGGGSDIASYLSAILEAVVTTIPVTDITPMLKNRTEIQSLVTNGSYIAVQAPFYFTSISGADSLRDEVKTAYYQGYGIRIEFTFQPWYCMSCSARHGAMTGRKVQTIFGFVRDISSVDGELVISLSCLGAGTAFKRHENRVRPNFYN
ncbi:HNH endonuclease signature motif containing protein [Shewanella khirikhana]|uniref:HNH domain-containing protein n=1 Tax=Shewanella khirikhana TaxID=1965282 RepID=A0ABM7DRH3_9GAMM|nr:HNH endonuclease signature motif containing protein [Shewanella khirikhana]AZQ12299.1 hypothetical protein STH12_03239 [Shewanella khirikhana]